MSSSRKGSFSKLLSIGELLTVETIFLKMHRINETSPFTVFAIIRTQEDRGPSMAAKQAEARRRHLARKCAQAARALATRMGSPPPVPGRKHEPVQTELFLEEVNCFSGKIRDPSSKIGRS